MGSSRFVCIMSNLAELLSLCASTARADAPGNIYVSALQKSGGTAFGAWGAWWCRRSWGCGRVSR